MIRSASQASSIAPLIGLYGISPWLGVEFSDHNFYGAGGLLTDFWLSDNLKLIPSLGIGYYPENGDVGLGGTLQFRSALELSYGLKNSGRLGISVSHISNGGIYKKNPGTEIIKIIYHIPLGHGLN